MYVDRFLLHVSVYMSRQHIEFCKGGHVLACRPRGCVEWPPSKGRDIPIAWGGIGSASVFTAPNNNTAMPPAKGRDMQVDMPV